MTKRDKKFTPGPWNYQRDSDVYTHIVRPRAKQGQIIVHLRQDTSGVSEANANLISAAPEMLNELEKSCAACSRLCGREPEDCEKCTINITIAKAYGETP